MRLFGTGAGRPHHHLVCLRCRRVCDLHDDDRAGLSIGPASAQGFEIRAVRVQVEGLCPECRTASDA